MNTWFEWHGSFKLYRPHLNNVCVTLAIACLSTVFHVVEPSLIKMISALGASILLLAYNLQARSAIWSYLAVIIFVFTIPYFL